MLYEIYQRDDDDDDSSFILRSGIKSPKAPILTDYYKCTVNVIQSNWSNTESIDRETYSSLKSNTESKNREHMEIALVK